MSLGVTKNDKRIKKNVKKRSKRVAQFKPELPAFFFYISSLLLGASVVFSPFILR